MDIRPPAPETKVLAIASHVVYGYVGNTMATFVMQVLGCQIAALNTVQYSNHAGYRQFRGTRTSPEEITDLYAGLVQSNLIDFDMLLSGYAPGAEAVEVIGTIARDLKSRAAGRPGGFFWVLDPVMGDEGHLYVDENVVPIYKSLLVHADLIVPNQFEAEILSSVKITSLSSLKTAISTLHSRYHIPHIVVTSVRLPSSPSSPKYPTISILASTATTTHTPRIFTLTIPLLPHFFSGTGDLFAGLLVVRFREACRDAGLLEVQGWRSPDDVGTMELPLRWAVERTVHGVQGVLGGTVRDMKAGKKGEEGGKRYDGEGEGVGDGKGGGEEGEKDGEKDGDVDDGEKKEALLARTKAAEVGVVRHVGCLFSEKVEYKAEVLDFEAEGEGEGLEGTDVSVRAEIVD